MHTCVQMAHLRWREWEEGFGTAVEIPRVVTTHPDPEETDVAGTSVRHFIVSVSLKCHANMHAHT